MGKEHPNKRRARGSGAIFYSASRGLWVARRPIGRSSSGNTRYQEVSAATQAEALEKLTRLLPPGPKTTVRQWCESWVQSLTVRASTRISYTMHVARYIVPVLGHLAVANLTPAQVEHASRVWGKQLGTSTVRLTLSVLRIALSAAIRAELLSSNPVSSAQKPRAAKTRITPFSLTELNRIITEACKHERTRIIAVLAATGCRAGEAGALDVRDFNPKTCTLSITKTRGAKGIGPPKSENGTRTITVPAQALPAVRAAVGKRKSGPLFPAPIAGGYRHYATTADAWRWLLKKLKLPYRNPHQLRHSVASQMVAAGQDVAEVARYLGDSPLTVLRVYCHATGADMGRAIEGLLRGGQEKTLEKPA